MTRLPAAVVAALVFVGALTVLPRAVAPPRPEIVQAEQARAATALVRAERWADALAPTQALAAQYPASHIYAEQLAVIHHHLRRDADEAHAWEQFIRTSPTPSEACPQIGEAYRRMNATARAVDAFDRCLAFEPDNPDLLFYAARAAEWVEKVDRAEQLYRRALAADARNMDVQLGLARVRLHQGDPGQALAGARIVLEQQPADADACLVAGLAALKLDRAADARGYFERGLVTNETYPDLHLGLGMVEEAERHGAAARAQYERALALDATRADIRQRLNRLTEGGAR